MRAFYYIWQWLWSPIANVLGSIAYLTLKCCGCKQHRYRNAFCTKIARFPSFGGFSMGIFIFYGADCGAVLPHEYGHSIQRLWWGVLAHIVIDIPSMTRYWWRVWYYKYRYPKTRKILPPYDSIWFEGQATKLGNAVTSPLSKWKWL